MKYRFFLLILISFFLFSCDNNYTESIYYLEKYSIIRQDWNDCITKLSYVDKKGKEIGEALFYYPGRDGWFLIDNIWGNNCIYLVLCDACPKLIINDSSQFIVKHDYQNINIDKLNWRRISSDDDAPVIQRTNEEYKTNVVKIGINSKMPNWNTWPGKYYQFDK